MRICFLLVAVLFAKVGFSATLHVPGMYPNIQAAVDAAVDGDVVLIADGTYTDSGNRNIDLKGKLITVASENGPAHCILDCQDKGRAFIITSQETRDCVVTGLTIRNGKSVGAGFDGNGQGIYIHDSSPVIRDCIIQSCGYISSSGDPPYGGGIYISAGVPLIQDCIIEDNAAGEGGGLYAQSSSLEVVGCTIRNNTAKWWWEGSFPPSHWEGDGGGMMLDYCTDVLVRDCVVADNNAYPDPNWGDPAGDGVRILMSSGYMGNGTVKGANGGYGVEIYFEGSSHHFHIENSILVFDGSAGPAIGYLGNLTVQYSNVQDGFPGVGNFDADPEFTDPSKGDFSLKPTSPCIDAGDPEYSPAVYYEDGARNPRLLDGDLDKNLVVDAGAHEYSNVRLSLEGDFTPGSNFKVTVDGKSGLAYMVLGGFCKITVPPLVKPFGHLLIFPAPGWAPILTLNTIPDEVTLKIPVNAPVGASIYLLPICRDGVSHAGNFGGYWRLVVL